MRSPRSLIRFDYLSVHASLLLGYALLGKVFAYQGVAPVYIGEMALMLGTCGFVFSVRRWMALRDWAVVPLLLFMLWGAIRAVPGVEEHGMIALRDSVIWGYGWFAVLVFTILATQPHAFRRLLGLYAHFSRIAILLVPTIWFASTVYGVVEFGAGGRAAPVLKGGEIMVHACGILAFLYAYERKMGAAWLLLLPPFLAIGMTTRAGLLSFAGTVVTLQVLRPARRRWFVVVGVLAIALGVMALADLNISVPGSRREISIDGLTSSLRSIFQETGSQSDEGTKRWRLQWWDKILEYTFEGEYFWTGKGFGVNLADDDGFELDSSHSLRSPHNGHLTILARTGVPGLALWALAQGCWLGGMLIGYVRARRNGRESLARLCLFLLGYWVGFMVNASFDVFLEGPMAGIWFWTVYGTGLAAIRISGRPMIDGVRSARVEAAASWGSGTTADCLARC